MGFQISDRIMRMPKSPGSDRNTILRGLPSVDELLRSAAGDELIRSAGRPHATNLARLAIGRVRAEAVARKAAEDLLRAAEASLKDLAASESLAGLRRVIN